MKVLAVDTSSRCGAIGLCIDGETVAELSLKSQENHSARLLPSIEWLLSTLRLTPQDVDAFGVVTGPGSFTGLRVGLATVKGLAWATNKPVTALHALEVLAQPFRYSNVLVVPSTDARKGRVYGAAYFWESGQLQTMKEAAEMDVQTLVADLPREFVLLGEGSRKYEKEIQSAAKKPFSYAPLAYDLPRGAILAQMAYERIQKGDTVDLRTVEPMYLRWSDA